MKILMINADRKLFEESSASRRRMVEYGKLVEEMHVIVFTRTGFVAQSLGNVFLYPTNSKSKWSYVCDAIKAGKSIIGSYRNDIVITTQDPFETGLAGWRLARKFKLPLQLQVHTDFLSPYFWRESLLNKARVCLAKFLIKRKQVKSIRVVSERIKRSLFSVHRSSPLVPTPFVLPIFVDVKKIEAAPVVVDLHEKYPQFDFIILMASRFSREKNIELAIDAFREAVKKYPKAGLIIVGEGAERKNYESKIKNYELDGSVILENWADDLSSYYKTADLFLLTSNYEGYGMSVVEAMAAHCAVVVTDVGLAGDVIKNEYSGLIVPVGDKQKLEDAILRMVDDKPLRYNLIISAQKIADEMASKDEYLRLYKKSWEDCLA